MRIPESCAQCLYDRQRKRMPDEGYLAEVRALIEGRGENDTSPLLVYRFNQAFARRFGSSDGYAEVKRRYNDLVLGMEDRLRARIEKADDPVAAALAAGGGLLVHDPVADLVAGGRCKHLAASLTGLCLGTGRVFAGDVAGSAAMQCRYLPLIRALFSEVNPIPVKAAMAAMGWCENYLRLPLTPMEEANWQRLRSIMVGHGLLN